MFTFNDEYLLKSMMSMVRDESSRIVSLGLATHSVLQAFIESPLHDAIKRVTKNNENKSIVLGALTNIYDSLNAIHLPGDFEKISSSVENQLCAALDIEIPLEAKETTSPEVESEPPSADDADDGDKEIEAICAVLNHITYDLGKKGNHKAAYLVERTLHKITDLGAK